MSESALDLKTSIDLLKKVVKYSAVPAQKHIDLSLVSASEQPKYEEALVVVKRAIFKGELTEEEFKTQVGLP